ncbi:hypothetical protein GCM10007315_35810 [Gemmobacter tilapiae]|uniref:Uncharacterized protein n=1 Tax=Neogemmobacter tilapiae TaxID=875041 RepID=A0A918WQS6_9RHOB|nr:hypothetical protein GCM10007315_35810 [Gemmobacter tilapiae]
MILMFWMARHGVGQAVLAQLARPSRNHWPDTGLSPQDIERADPECSVKQELNVVDQEQTMTGHRICQVLAQL